MPHATADDEIGDFLADEDIGNLPALDELNDRDLEFGEKADDAQDYEDIEDDDLAEEEPEILALATKPPPEPVDEPVNEPEFNGYADINLDDLFGENEDVQSPDDVTGVDPLFDDPQDIQPSIEQSGIEELELSDEDDEVREQRLLFEQARLEREERQRRADSSGDLPPPPTDAELFSAIWPQFEPNKPPRFGELLPGKRAYYVPKAPLKPPKPINPTKVNLDIAQDQEKSFKLPQPPPVSFVQRQAEAEAKGLVLVTDTEPAQEDSEDDEDFDLSEETEDVGGISWQDFVSICQDWNIPGGDSDSENALSTKPEDEDEDEDLLFGENFLGQDVDSPASKKRKTNKRSAAPLRVLHNFNISIDDPERATAKLAKKVHLNMNDPHMLLDVQQPSQATGVKRKLDDMFKRDSAGGLTKDFAAKYNIANDEAYELLKENHQSKIRSQLGNISIEHATPAQKLQYPFYKVQLSAKEARSWHRPTLAVSPGYIFFDKGRFTKRKHIRGKTASEIFQKSEDLTIGDNSNLLLLEYSEEYPSMLSSFGMGSRLINYYRRRDNEDTARPKFDLGETSVLLPQDKSPFSIFGDVDGGQSMPTISNSMYRAPVFRHDERTGKGRDFVVSRNSTSVEGSTWHLRNVENLHVVGQEFPSVEVPGTHSRKVTDAAKKRLRMVSYRMYKRYHKLTNEMVLRHLPGSEIAQNRSKMREFMDYDKQRASWEPRNDIVPDNNEIRSMVKPEDVSLLYSMQVGDRQLQDAGYNKDSGEDDENDDDEKSGQSINEQLAPWQTSKNFLNACQGKAMLQLHGEGDPTGRGDGFSFIRTSMKGGFQPIGQSIEERLDSKKQKELGGHSYNVAQQARAYNEAIRRIWDNQSRTLSSSEEHDDIYFDDPEENSQILQKETPGRAASFIGGGGDEASSMISKESSYEQSGQFMRITRWSKDKYGNDEPRQEIVRDPNVIREYKKKRRQLDQANMSLEEMKRTGDEKLDAERKQMLVKELERLEKTRSKGGRGKKRKDATDAADSPEPSGSQTPALANGDEDDDVTASGGGKRRKVNSGQTQRKCANCGQIGHIKTNKKLCPLLNGQIKQDEPGGDSAFGSINPTANGTPVPVAPPTIGSSPPQ